jgi:pimeloyl-ACP methyl ester carboxylesterase
MQPRKTRSRRSRALLAGAGVCLGVLLVAYIAACAFFADRISRAEHKPITTTPAAYGLQYESVSFASAVDSIPLEGWYIDSPGGPTVMVMHGKDSARDNYISMEVSRALVQHGYSVFLFDFRGSGASGGDRVSLGQWETRDVAGALEYLKTRGVDRVGAIGYSMGAATELLAAPNHPEMQAIVADSSFANLSDVINHEALAAGIPFPGLFEPGFLLVARLAFGLDVLSNQPTRAVSSLGDRPILIIHCDRDPLVPVSQAYKLQAAGAANPKLQLWVAAGRGHVDAFASNREEYISRVTSFFDKYLR